MTEIIFRDNKIQKGFRVKIPKAIIDTLGLEEGKRVVVKFDVQKRKIVVEEEKKGGKK